MEFKLKGKVIFFATNNFHKFNEARKVLTEFRIAVVMLRVKAHEIQSDSLTEIASANAIDAFDRCQLPLIIEDAGFFVNALKGFPGPYAAYAYKTVGNAGLLKLMENIEDRNAIFKSAIAYFDGQGVPVSFEGKVSGKIVREERIGNERSGFGFDPIFHPAGNVKTFAEMTLEEKNRFSHRAKAISKFAKWYKKFL